jgi:hypothetical protein
MTTQRRGSDWVTLASALGEIAGCGLGEAREFRAAFPEVDHIRLLKPNGRLPCDDSCFEIAVSNAVLEYVGNSEIRLSS